MNKSWLLIMMLSATSVTTLALADNSGNNGGDRPHGPPMEAIKACEGKSAGQTVQFQARDGNTISGTCQLIAVPDQMRGSQGGGQGAGPQGGNNNQGGPQGIQ